MGQNQKALQERPGLWEKPQTAALGKRRSAGILVLGLFKKGCKV
jgi:hypothetical protein